MPLPKPPAKPATILASIPSNVAQPINLVAPVKTAPPEARSRSQAPAQPASAAARLALVEAKARNGKKARLAGPPKLFVLDTNVLMHDPTSLFRFEEHDVFLPMVTLEELDSHKKGMSEVARNARQVSRSLDALVAACATPIEDGIALDALGNNEAKGRLFFQTQAVSSALPPSLPAGKADNQILGVVRSLKELHTRRDVVLVSKDINMRVKARALGLPAEDYYNDKVLEDTDILYTGMLQLPGNFWDKHGKGMESWQQAGFTYYRVHGPLASEVLVNQFVYLENGTPFYAQAKEVVGKSVVLRVLRDYMHAKNAVWGITARNLEVLNKSDDAAGEWGRAATNDLIRTRIRIKSLNFMRGRTFISKYLIIDEAQNLTPKQMKTLITRAGPGTKVVCLGNIAQIDTPYLTEGSSGLTYVVDRMKGRSHSGHVTLQRGERSRLADHAAEAL